MGADIKNLRVRIRSVDSTLHLTKAMGLVASAKIRRSQEAMRKGRDYAAAVERAVSSLATCPECKNHPYVAGNGSEKTRIVVIAGDRGLCGGYNANVFRALGERAAEDCIPIGKRAADHFGAPPVSSETYSRQDGYELAARLCREYREGKFGRLLILYTRYRNVMSQEPCFLDVLPLPKKEEASGGSVLFEPSAEQILDAAVTEYVAATLLFAVRESFACEVAARRAAMDSAGKNAEEMLSDLRIRYNRARQGAITQEITEIVAGSGG